MSLSICASSLHSEDSQSLCESGGVNENQIKTHEKYASVVFYAWTLSWRSEGDYSWKPDDVIFDGSAGQACDFPGQILVTGMQRRWTYSFPRRCCYWLESVLSVWRTSGVLNIFPLMGLKEKPFVSFVLYWWLQCGCKLVEVTTCVWMSALWQWVNSVRLFSSLLELWWRLDWVIVYQVYLWRILVMS